MFTLHLLITFYSGYMPAKFLQRGKQLDASGLWHSSFL